MKIPYTKAQMLKASASLPKGAMVTPNENLSVLTFKSTSDSVSHARATALKFVSKLVKLAAGANAPEGLAEDILAEASYHRVYLDEPGKVHVTYKFHNTLIRQSKNNPAAELQLDRELVGV